MDDADITLPEGFSRAGRGDAYTIGEITADAFRNDPFNQWLFDNYKGIRSLFHMQARRIYVPRGLVYKIGDLGAAMWMLPGGSASFSQMDYAAFALPTIWHCGLDALRKGIKTGEAMERAHPDFEHAYLFSIGVRPSQQGKGLGRKLIQPVLDACDQTGTRAYLENSNPANCGFYASCGFEPCGEIRPAPDAPPLIPMVREPRPL